MWECKLQGWMLDNLVIEELLQVTEIELHDKVNLVKDDVHASQTEY